MMWGIIITIVVSIVALIATMFAFKQDEKKALQYEEEGNTIEHELKRSHEYETKSISRNVKNLTWIYVIVIVLSCIGLAIYMYSL